VRLTRGKLQGVTNRNLFYLCNLRNLWLNPLFFGLKHYKMPHATAARDGSPPG